MRNRASLSMGWTQWGATTTRLSTFGSMAAGLELGSRL